MDETFLQSRSIGVVGLGGTTDKTFLEEESFEWFKAGYYYVNSHVVLIASEKMRL